MREIKFRAWDKQNKCWFIPGDMWVNLQIPSGDIIWGDLGSDEGRDDDFTFEISQFTGLYDKHKKPIFEGDVIGIPHRGSHAVKSLIYFEHGAFCREFLEANVIKIKGETWDYMPPNCSGEGNPWEIIGNIYEHPHLLKESK